MPHKTASQLWPETRTFARIIARLLLSLALAALLCGAWLITSCTQAQQAQQEQNQQTRPRRSTLEIKNPSPNRNTTGEAENRNQSSEQDNKKNQAPVPFYAALEARGVKLEGICAKDDAVARRVLEDYGAMFVAAESVKPPPVCMFQSEAEVTRFQNEAGFTSATVGGTKIDLQPAAMQALLDARKEANAQGLDITPRGGSEAARRSYSDTLRLWNSRFLPALSYWNSRGRFSKEEAARLRALPIHEQVRDVLELEKRGIYFSKDLSKSILYSVAAPGTSQHISMLALDVSQFGNERVRSILARHGWFQTVKSDLPHFTYLGVDETELPAHGLRQVKIGGQVFWIPNVGVE
jgi:hypothetical protein